MQGDRVVASFLSLTPLPTTTAKSIYQDQGQTIDNSASLVSPTLDLAPARPERAYLAIAFDNQIRYDRFMSYLTEQIPEATRIRIEGTLKRIEAEESVRILYACESGSRAWGFASAGSDFDVRFLYVRLEDWYLCVDDHQKRDVIELPIVDELDISGWDLKKALLLLYKSNPPLLEWLQSPIVYRTSPEAEQLAKLATQAFSPIRCRYHYLSMANSNYSEHLRRERVRLKKYLYVLRPLLAIRWLDSNKGRVPVELGTLLDSELPETEVREQIDQILVAKAASQELDDRPRIDPLNRFIEEELKRAGSVKPPRTTLEVSMDEINAFFRSCVKSNPSSVSLD